MIASCNLVFNSVGTYISYHNEFILGRKGLMKNIKNKKYGNHGLNSVCIKKIGSNYFNIEKWLIRVYILCSKFT